MFEIEYKGGNGVVITTKKTTVVIDPKISVVGLKDISVKDAVEITTEPRFTIENDAIRLLIEGPGDYEIGDFSIHGISATRHIDSEQDEKIGTIYRIEIDDVRIALLGNVSAKLTDEQLESLGVVDLMIVPVGGGGYTLDAVNATALVRLVDPKAVIPVHYADNALEYEVPQDELGLFTKELGAPVETISKYKVKNSTALPAVLTVIEITRS